jgi:hypothetical protein
MNTMKSLKLVAANLSETDLAFVLAIAHRMNGGETIAETEDTAEAAVPRPKANKKNAKNAAEPEKRGRGRPKMTEADKAAKAKAAAKPAKEKPAAESAEEFEFNSSVKKADRAGVIAKIKKIMDNDSIAPNDLKAKYEKKGVEINFGRGRKGDAAKKKIILVAAANAGQKI